MNWLEPEQALAIPPRGLLLTHAPASRAVARVAQFTITPVTLLAYNGAGLILDQKTAPAQQGTSHELVLNGQGHLYVSWRAAAPAKAY